MPEGVSRMQISPDEGVFIQWLCGLMRVQKYVEVGTFTGYSSLCVALATPADASLVCCDVSKEYTDVARTAWEKAGVAEKIALRLAPATETLDDLLAHGAAGTFDLAFIDADKPNYSAYYERLVQLMRPGGVILIDNVLWHGQVADPAFCDADTVAIRAINDRVSADPRVAVSTIGVADGLTLARVL